ncbi:hypothetical protein QR680_010146 [Steinernema hermaphroditum]|uniref:Uncharacterized protein n=1 Tax=Steinernema hermaphroditum TaxID=289476 RepID=A0AA39IQI8_9BILA|nr:hypothetical protein QR680_010146 [Steinernema hermaphroditum]
MVSSIVVGLLYIFLVFTTLPLHVIILTILLQKSEFRNLTAYRIMMNMSMAECVIILGHAAAGIMSICQTTFNSYFDRISGCFVSVGWVGVTLLSLTLSLNRFLVFVGFKIAAKTEMFCFKLMIVFVWTVTAVLFGVHLIPEASITYDTQIHAYRYRHTGARFAVVIEHIEYFGIFVALSTVFILSVGTVFAIIVKRNLHSTRFKLSSPEIKLFIQSLIIFIYLSTIRCLWHFGRSIICSCTAFIALGLATQLIGGLNTVLYLLFNRTLRGYFLEVFKLRTNVVKVAITSSEQKHNNRLDL